MNTLDKEREEYAVTFLKKRIQYLGGKMTGPY